MSKSRPILLSGELVPPTLSDLKTQTRRLVTGTALEWLQPGNYFTPGFVAHPDNRLCRYGQPGDTLWVREAWRTVAAADPLPPRDLTPAHRIWYEADAPHQPGAGKLRPSMFMPRWASRITLLLKAVRVERLNEISEADAIAEGCGWNTYQDQHGERMEPIEAFAALWERINGPGSWDLNPWVWVLSYERVK